MSFEGPFSEKAVNHESPSMRDLVELLANVVFLEQLRRLLNVVRTPELVIRNLQEIINEHSPLPEMSLGVEGPNNQSLYRDRTTNLYTRTERTPPSFFRVTNLETVAC